MTSIVDVLYELKYNPFEYGAYFASFYTVVDGLDNNLLLAPLIIPLCSHPIFRPKILKSNIKSTIWSIFDDRTKLYDLQERINEFQVLTEQSIQYCLVNDWLFVDEQNLSLLRYDYCASNFTKQKSAEKLGRLFSDHTVVEIYAFLGVKPQ